MVFDFIRVDVFAVAVNNHIFGTPDDKEVSVLADLAQIASPQPTILQRVARRFFVIDKREVRPKLRENNLRFFC